MIEQYITTIALSAIGLVTIGALTLGTAVYRKLKPLYEARFTAEQRKRIEQLAHDAYAYAETKFAGQGAAKFHGATKYLADKLGAVGIQVGSDEIESAVQLAWERFNPGKTKRVDSELQPPEDVAKAAVSAFAAKVSELVNQAVGDNKVPTVSTKESTAVPATQPPVTAE
ncbi:phage holin, LLH family [Paenibacillus sp. EKM211P]|uniref:phage holin, LLH family n=1 Tax=Paenibacillus sp. EKM211P TaxID=1683679 RepID=UPI0013E94F28|nr:phage holin, LLH family [Paenibacillus sp. EKM211P]KAF6582776.1 hypothetical protein G9G57_16025 [Paenibacillus sp. EKM211P]